MKLLIKLLIIGALFYSCNSKSTSPGVEFYTDHGGMDYARIPFINPYEAVILNGSKSWLMNLQAYGTDLSVSNIQTAAITSRVITMYSTNTLLDGAYAKESWYIVIPDKHIEKGFGTHKDYVKYLLGLGIKQEPKLYDINTIAKYYGDHDAMNWKDFR